MKYRYRFLEVNPEVLRRLAESINVSDALSAALIHRGITTFEQAKKFFRPSLSHLHSPFLMKDMARAVTRLQRALQTGESIMIYGDYDVDGTTGTSLLYLSLKRIAQLLHSSSSIWYYINDRRSEGYGVAISGLENAALIGVTLLISVDCGISAHEGAVFCNDNSIDFVICDHHQPPPELPEAYAILNPKQPFCTYPFKELSGCGVAFKLIHALCLSCGLPETVWSECLDFVALAAAADIVEMTDENRVLMAEGLKRLTAHQPRLPFKAMAVEAGLDLSKATSTNLLFTIAPRINAAGRMGHARDAVKWLISENDTECVQLAAQLNEQNTLRRDLDKAIFQEAEKMAEHLLSSYPYSSLVLYHPEWHLGVVGIVAAKIVERFYLPTIILTENKGILKGSARSVSGVNLYQALHECREYLIQFGGHAYAAGMSLEVGQLEAFRRQFDDAVYTQFDFELRTPEIMIDAELPLEAITPNFFSVLEQFEPFGPLNLKPVFYAEQRALHSPPQLLKALHLKVLFSDAHGRVFEGIGFNMVQEYERLKTAFDKNPEERVFVVYSLERSEWNGQRKIQLRLRDILPESMRQQMNSSGGAV